MSEATHDAWAGQRSRHHQVRIGGQRWALGVGTPGADSESPWTIVESRWGLREIEGDLLDDGVRALRQLLDDEGCAVPNDDYGVLTVVEGLLEIGQFTLWVQDCDQTPIDVAPPPTDLTDLIGEPTDDDEPEESERCLEITHCPALFDPRIQALPISAHFMGVKNEAIELLIRSDATGRVVHQTTLSPGQTHDGTEYLEWDGIDPETGEPITRALAPFTVELVLDSTLNDIASTDLPPPARVHIVEMEDVLFATGRAILMPDGGAEAAPDDTQRATGLHAVAAVLRHAAFHPHKAVRVFGHTDTVGSDADNMVLSTDRATGLLHLLTGDVDAWATHCDTHFETADVQRVLRWAAQTRGWATDPGAIDNALGPKTKAARRAFRERANAQYGTQLAINGGQTIDDWHAYAALYDEALAEIMRGTVEDLRRIRDEVAANAPQAIGCGETFPADQPDVNNLASATNRRVDVVFFASHELPELPGDPAGEPLYGTGDFDAQYLPIGHGDTHPIRLRLLDHGTPVANEQYTLEHNGEVVQVGRTTSGGFVEAELPTEDGETILRLPSRSRRFMIDVATLAPLSDLAGVQGRLQNLGYPCLPSGDLDEETQAALLAFQHTHGLPTTGEPDADTIAALQAVHGT